MFSHIFKVGLEKGRAVRRVLGLLMNLDQQKLFLQRAEEARPSAVETMMFPKGEVIAKKSPTAFQGWRLDPVTEGESYTARSWNKSGEFILDFGEHIVGHFTFSLLVAEGTVDAPVRLRLTFGEVASEVCESIEPYKGALSRGWFQDETLNVLPPDTRVIVRRMAFRYVKVEIISPPGSVHVRFADVSVTARTSASRSRLLPYKGPEDFRDIDEVAVRTLANCMQDVFEDGPKRDRRLWLGDLRLQALADEVTFKNDSLVRRCLYLLAAFAPEDDLIPSDVYNYPRPIKGASTILDYALLFAPTLLEHAKRSGDWETAKALWPIAKRQIEIVAETCIDARGLFVDPKKYWLFIDWREGLHKESPVHGVMIYALGSLMELAEKLGLQAEVSGMADLRKKMVDGALAHLRDGKTGLFLSGPKKQLSWASQVWLILGGVVSPEEGRVLLSKLMERKDVLMPAGPYLYHYVVDAMLQCGMKQEALDLMRRYWGGMVRLGASTFWEVYDPENDLLSPYCCHQINSYCHAWSCTPTYFLRKYFS